MKKWILYLLFLANSLLVADKNNDEFQQHAQSWVPVQNQQNYAGYREYVNSVDGMRCRVIDSQTKQTFTTYNASGQKLDSFDLFYGNSTESSLMSSSPILHQNGQQQHSGGAQNIGSNSTQQNSAFVQNQQFIAQCENNKAQMRARSFDNEQTRDQEMALRLKYNLITFEDFQAYYQAKEDYKKYVEQQEQDRLQKIKDLKKLVRQHKKEWSDLQTKHAQELRTEKNQSHQYIKRIKARHKQDEHNLLLQQYDENPTYGKYLYLACKKVKDGAASLVGTDYQPAPAPVEQKKIIPVSPQQFAQDIAFINNFQQQKIIEQQLNLQNLYHEHCDTIDINRDPSQDFQQIMHDRSAAFERSLQNQTTTSETLTLKNQTICFMQAHNIDPALFTQSSGLAINHQMIREMIDVIDKLADCSSRHCANNFVQQGAAVCAQMATMAQQENHVNHLSESISAANCSHGLLHYVQGMALEGLQRCDQMIQALSYYNVEMSKYLLFAAKGAAQGVASVEIAALTMQAIGSAASACAPALTATTPAAAAPIAVAAGVVAVTAIVGEVARLGYFYATDQLIKIDADYHKIKDFAAKFYDFDQTSYEHVENISQAATTLLWPVKAQAIIDSLQGIQKAQVNFYVQGKKVVERSVGVSNEMLENAVSKVNSFEFQEFNATYKKIFNQHIFEFSAPPQVALAGISENFIEQEIVSLIPRTHLLTEQTNKVTEKVVGSVIGKGATDTVGQYLDNEVAPTFLDTQVGKNMQQLITKDYEQNAFDKIIKEYGKLVLYKTQQELVDQFLRCYEIAPVPTELRKELDFLQNEFSTKEYEGVVIQLKHIFYPKITPKFDENYQVIKQFVLEGFHHDEYGSLEKSGLFSFVAKTYGDAAFGAEECFIGATDWGNGIIYNKDKTFFPSSWSKEKTAQVIFEANKNRIKELGKLQKTQTKFLCKGPNNMLIDLVIDDKNVIISAYPSEDNFFRN